MNLRQLQYFVAIAEEGSFTRAATRLLVAQPSLSQQMKRLERELGGQLLERLPNGVRLTAAGKVFLTDARISVTYAERATRQARSALGLEAGELEVATVTSVAFGVLPPAFELWHTRYPATTISLREYQHRRALEDAVRAGVGDIAVGPRPRQWEGPVVKPRLGRIRRCPPAIRSTSRTPPRRLPRGPRRSRLGAVFAGSRPDGTHPRRVRTRRLRSARRRADRSGCRGRPPCCGRIRRHSHPKQRRPTRTQRPSPKLEAASGAPARCVRTPGLVASRARVPGSTSSPVLGEPTTLCDRSRVASHSTDRIFTRSLALLGAGLPSRAAELTTRLADSPTPNC
jgi:DNA-binding transcriptional LysR family regulator